MSALLQRRLGVAAFRGFHDDIVPILNIEWAGERQHLAAVTAALAASRRRLSVVDCVSFQTMRENGVHKAFCFDRQFREQGFEVVP
jgi:predicted nucleic acid-binding protein